MNISLDIKVINKSMSVDEYYSRIIGDPKYLERMLCDIFIIDEGTNDCVNLAVCYACRKIILKYIGEGHFGCDTCSSCKIVSHSCLKKIPFHTCINDDILCDICQELSNYNIYKKWLESQPLVDLEKHYLKFTSDPIFFKQILRDSLVNVSRDDYVAIEVCYACRKIIVKYTGEGHFGSNDCDQCHKNYIVFSKRVPDHICASDSNKYLCQKCQDNHDQSVYEA